MVATYTKLKHRPRVLDVSVRLYSINFIRVVLTLKIFIGNNCWLIGASLRANKRKKIIKLGGAYVQYVEWFLYSILIPWS